MRAGVHYNSRGLAQMSEFDGIFIISCAAVAAPLLNRLPMLARAPVVALELLLEIVIGPSGAGVVASDPTMEFLGQFGLHLFIFPSWFRMQANGYWNSATSSRRLGLACFIRFVGGFRRFALCIGAGARAPVGGADLADDRVRHY